MTRAVKALCAAALVAGLVGPMGAGCVKEQSFAESMTTVCGARELSGLTERVSNPEAREVLARAGTQPRYRVPALIDRAARRAGLHRCAIVEALGPVLPFDPPAASRRVADGGRLTGRRVAIGPTAITLDGREIVRLVGGEVPRDARRDGPLGSTIQAIVDGLTAKGGASPSGTGAELALLMAPAISYRTVFETVMSARGAGWTRFQILVTSPDGLLGSLPLALPDALPGEAQAGAADPPVQLIVSVTGRELMLWSISGLEGTLAAPRFRLPSRRGQPSWFDAARLGDALVGVVDARWRGGVPPPEQRQIIIQADPDVPFQTIVDLMIAVRSREDGRPLFPEVLLGKWSFD